MGLKFRTFIVRQIRWKAVGQRSLQQRRLAIASCVEHPMSKLQGLRRQVIGGHGGQMGVWKVRMSPSYGASL